MLPGSRICAAPVKGMHPAITLTTKTSKEVVTIHLRPEYYIGRLDIKIEKSDKSKIRGSRATLDGKPVIMATEVKESENTLPRRLAQRRGRLLYTLSSATVSRAITGTGRTATSSRGST